MEGRAPGRPSRPCAVCVSWCVWRWSGVAGRAFSSTEMKLSERRALENAACQWVSDNGCLRDAI